MGPAVATYERIEQLIHAGMNVARLNFSHGTHEDHGKTIRLLKEVRDAMNVPLAIMLDTKGPEVRIGNLKGKLTLRKGDTLCLVKETCEGDSKKISLRPVSVIDELRVGTTLLFDNGYVIAKVIACQKDRVSIEIEHGGDLKSSKGVNIPGVELDLPSMTEKDLADLRFGCSQDVDWIAASFIRSAEDVIAIKKLLEEDGHPEIGVIAKIENLQGVENFDSIVQVADGIMVARGDLGVELPLTQVPRLQKMMIRKSYLAGKPAITATQMLESMILNPRPTRAETSDVANAIYDSTSAVMLSAETAVGVYPIETVEVMKGIIQETEEDFDYYEFFRESSQRFFHGIPSSVAQATVKTAFSTRAKAIFAFSTSGSTVRLLSRMRPQIPIIALTPSKKVFHQLSLGWGVVPLFAPNPKTIEEAFDRISAFALEHGWVQLGDLVVITAGTPFGRSGTTNMMIVDTIGDVLVRAEGGQGSRISGKIVTLRDKKSIQPFHTRGKILVLEEWSDEMLPLVKPAAAVLLDQKMGDSDSVEALLKLAHQFDLPVLFGAKGALQTLREEQLVTIDPEQALVYKGIVTR